MSSTNQHAPSTTPRAPTRATGWTGWIAFASVVMMLSGTLTGISGFLAVINHNWTMWNNDGAPYGTVYWWGWWTLFVGVVVFAIGALRGPRQHPYGLIFAKLVAPRLSPVTEREPVPPLKFAQLVGFVFAVAGVAGFALGVPLLGVVATAFALFAAFLNAAFGICLGCQIYPLVARLRRTPNSA